MRRSFGEYFHPQRGPPSESFEMGAKRITAISISSAGFIVGGGDAREVHPLIVRQPSTYVRG